MSLKVLVFGGAGYIGSILTHSLLNHGHKVKVVDNFMYKNQAATYGFIGHFNYQLHNGHIQYPDSYMSWPDIIIPLAAIVGAPACERQPILATTINRDAIIHLVKLCSKHQRILFPNTNSGYGMKGETLCTEESPLAPLSLYGKTKCEAEKAVLDHPNSVVFRLATVAGVSQRMRFDLLVNNWIAELNYKQTLRLYQPDYKRNFVHIRDVARAFCYAIFHPEIKGVYNLGDDRANMTKIELAKLIAGKLGFTKLDEAITIAEGSDPDQRNYLVSSEKMMKTGFRCYYDLDKAIDEVIDLCRITPNDGSVFRMVNV